MRRPVKAVLLGAMVAGIGTTGFAVAQPALSAPQAPAQVREYTITVPNMVGEPQVRPEQWEFAMGQPVSDIRWQSWGGTEAVGHGTLSVNPCDPSCAEDGQETYSDATIVFSAPQPRDGGTTYTRYTITAPGLSEQQRELLHDQPIFPED